VNQPKKLVKTYNTILPNFIKNALKHQLVEEKI
jgi:hypothetical protein